MATTIDLSIEDGRCIARKVVNTSDVPTLIAVPENDIVARWARMTDEKKKEVLSKIETSRGEAYALRTPLASGLDREVRERYSHSVLMERFPDAQWVEYCDARQCIFPKKLDGTCRWIHEWESFRGVKYCTRCLRTENRISGESLRHIHAIADMENGKESLILNVYNMGDYLQATKSVVPGEVFDMVEKSPGDEHHIATPEVLNIPTKPRITDPLLIAEVGQNHDRYVIWQWE